MSTITIIIKGFNLVDLKGGDVSKYDEDPNSSYGNHHVSVSVHSSCSGRAYHDKKTKY